MATNGILKFQGTNKATFVGATSNVVIDTVKSSLGIGVDVNGPTSNLHVVGNAYVSTELTVGGTVTAAGFAGPLTGAVTGDGSGLTTLNATNIASGTLDVARIPALDTAKITTGTLDAARIPALDTAKITTGTLDAARIPALDTAKITTGTLDAARIPALDTAKITTGTLDAARIPTLNQNTTGSAGSATTAGTCSGNSATATTAATLTTAQTIGGVSFDGSAAIVPTTFGAATFSGDVTVDSTTFHVDSTNNRVGIGTTSPDKAKLQINNTLALLNPSYKSASDDDQLAGKIEFYLGGSSNELSTPVAAIEGYDKYAGGSYAGALALKVHGGEKMRILSNGNVGIGTTSPGYPLDVQFTGDSGIRSKNTGSSHASVYIDSATGYSYLRFEHSGAAKFWIQATPTGDLAFRPSGGGHVMDILNNGNVGIGTSTPYAKLHVNGGAGAVAVGWRKYFRWSDPGYGSTGLGGNNGYGWGTHSIYASEAIITSNYFVSVQGAITSSDERIKKDIVDVEDGKALDIIRELKPKKYRYKDEINRGVEPVWGFIAQEVNDILPEAIKIDEECLPNIYEMANVSSSNVITFTNFDTSTLESNASVLKVFDEDDNEHLLTIDKVIDEHSIRVKEDRTESQLFIYGQRVNDFHRIRKETVWTVATAALQEVDRQLQAEKTKVTTLETQLASVLTRLDALENA